MLFIGLIGFMIPDLSGFLGLFLYIMSGLVNAYLIRNDNYFLVVCFQVNRFSRSGWCSMLIFIIYVCKYNNYHELITKQSNKNYIKNFIKLIHTYETYVNPIAYCIEKFAILAEIPCYQLMTVYMQYRVNLLY